MFEVDFKILNQKATPAIYADTLALRPAAGFEGRLFVATDSPYGVFRDTGTAWVQVAGIGGGGGSTGINGLNGTTNIGLGGTLANNTNIAGDNFTLTLQGFSSIASNTTNGSDSTQILSLGNNINIRVFDVGSNATEFKVNNYNIATTFGNNNYGLSLNDNNGKFAIGDYSNSRKYNSFVVNDDTDRFYFTTTYNQANTDQDLLYASTNTSANERFIKLGDFNNYTNGFSLIVDDTQPEIYSNTTNGKCGFSITNTESFFGAINSTDFCALYINYVNRTISAKDVGNITRGLIIDYVNEIYTFGDNNAEAIFNNTSQSIELQTNTLIFTGAPLQDPLSGGFANMHLLITLNGVPYKIRLENP